jgi:hypothetical protein
MGLFAGGLPNASRHQLTPVPHVTCIHNYVRNYTHIISRTRCSARNTLTLQPVSAALVRSPRLQLPWMPQRAARKRMRSGDRPGLQNRRAAGNPAAGGFDPHSLPPFFNDIKPLS